MCLHCQRGRHFPERDKVYRLRRDPLQHRRHPHGLPLSRSTPLEGTGQRLEAEIGLYFYNTRFYDATLGRFAQADTIIPGAGNPLALDRYAYVQNNSLRYNDPSGHYYCGDTYDSICLETPDEWEKWLLLNYGYEVYGPIGHSDSNHRIDEVWTKDIHASAELVEFMLDWEEFRAVPYDDGYGNYTVGWGHNIGTEVTDAEYEMYANYSMLDFWDLFLEDLHSNETNIRIQLQYQDNHYFPDQPDLLGSYLSLTQSKIDALIDFSFSAGSGNAEDLIIGMIVGPIGNPYIDISYFIDELTVTYSQLGGGIATRRLQNVDMFMEGIYDSTH